MRLGTSLARKDDAGVELCLELNTPTYGEEPAQATTGGRLLMPASKPLQAIGWQPAEAVPAMYYHPLPGGMHALFVRVVDDVMIVVPTEAEQVVTRYERSISSMMKMLKLNGIRRRF